MPAARSAAGSSIRLMPIKASPSADTSMHASPNEHADAREFLHSFALLRITVGTADNAVLLLRKTLGPAVQAHKQARTVLLRAPSSSGPLRGEPACGL